MSDNNDYKEFISLKEYFFKKGIQQIDIAKSIGVTNQYVYAILNEKQKIGASTAKKINVAYGIPVEEILSNKINNNTPKTNQKTINEGDFITHLKKELDELKKERMELLKKIDDLTGKAYLLSDREKQIEELKQELREERGKSIQLKNTEYETKTESKQGGGTRKTTHSKPSAGGARK
jgi:transcriptional regulator with XRE-family HTH domain